MTKNNFARALVVWFLTFLCVFFTGVLTGFYARNLVVALIATVGLGLIRLTRMAQTTKAEEKFSYRVEQINLTLLILP